MGISQSNQFQFIDAGNDADVTVLHAVMSDFSYGNHAHDEFSLGVTLKGIQEFSCNGSCFRSSPGNIIVFNPGDVHNGNPGNDDALEYTMLYIDPVLFFQLADCATGIKGGAFHLPETNFVDTSLRSLILNVSSLVTEPGGTSLEYELGLYEIARCLAQRMGTYRPDAGSAVRDSLLLLTRDFIHDNIAQNITVDDLCGVANMSKFHFIRLFRRQFGMTPHQYILNHRINRVREELKTGAAPSRVAQDFGFFDASHMNRHFKRSYGVTPKQYQHQLLK